tara:strand:+ start:1355 stop:2374 length:1020 start_codon:yes stop_codon:yes gene_type:complete
MIKAEYIWVDGTKPTAQVRSKTRILTREEATNPPVWGFDGSSTNQAEGNASDCVLNPVEKFRDPLRGGDNILILCEVLNVDMTPHDSNTRNALVETYSKHKESQPWFGLEQEYTFMDKSQTPLGLLESVVDNELNPLPQGPYYCGAGAGLAVGREIVEEHLDACIKANLKVTGVNAEVMPGQWEYQIGAADPITISDHLWVARYLLQRVAEKYLVVVSLDPKPADGDWNGAGCHTNFSTKEMRGSLDACERAAVALGERHKVLIQNYGEGIESRLTGDHETCSYKEFKYGVSDRGASIRIPWQVAKEDGGYIEDRRPNANCDPYVVTRLITETVCEMAV